jgi:hypothetical protein
MALIAASGRVRSEGRVRSAQGQGESIWDAGAGEVGDWAV